MYNDLSKLKLNLMLIRKASIRVALVLLLVYLVLHFSSLRGWMFEELTSFSQISSITFFVLSTTMFVLEDEIQKIMNKSPFGGAGSGFNAMMQPMGGFGSDMSFENYKNGMQDYTSEGGSDDLFAPLEEGSELEVEIKDQEIVALEEENEDYWKTKLESIPERTRSDFKERVTALRDLTEKRFDLLRNEFLAHVFGTPEGDELPEGQDPLTFNPKSYHCGVYVSNVLLDMYGGEWLHYQNRLKTLFQDDYKIDFDDEGNVSYQLK